MATTTSVGLQLRNIFVPVDFSKRSESAVRMARAIAEQHGSTIYLANVIESFEVSGIASSGLHKKEAGQAAKDFLSMENKWLSGIKHESLVLDGDVNLSLSHAIEQRDIDLVVMATQGTRGCERLFMGSRTEELFREASCPVLALGPNLKKEFGRFALFSNLLYPMEITPSSIAAIPWIAGLVNVHETGITLLHVVHPDIGAASERQRIRERISSEMRALFPEATRSSIADIIVEFGQIAETIVEFSLAKRADAIVLGVRSAGSFTRAATHAPWSIAHQIIAEARCPVLTIRSK